MTDDEKETVAARVDGQPSADHGDLPRRATSPSAHTPGPWEARRIMYPKRLDVSFEVSAARGFVCQTIMREIASEREVIEQDEANATLIAAAPDLLEALKAAELLLDEADLDYEAEGAAALRLMRAAIAKAEGR